MSTAPPTDAAGAGRRRLAVVGRHLLPPAATAATTARPPSPQLARAPTASSYGAPAAGSAPERDDDDGSPSNKGVGRSLPRFSAYVMECYLDDLRDMKKEVYGSLRGRPDLLPAVEEGMTKEQHRELVRGLMRAMIDSGFSPLQYFDR